MVKNPIMRIAKKMYKGSGAPKKAGMHRPEGAGNFDNMDDYNIVDSINANVVKGSTISGVHWGDGSNLTGITGTGDNLGNHLATQTISGVAATLTQDRTGSASGVAFVVNTIFGTGSTPPTASSCPIGTVYNQYTP